MIYSIRQLQYLVTLYKSNHFGMAAEQCCVNQSALSMGIRELENILEVQLFERTKRRVQATEVCHQLIPIALDILDKSEAFVKVAKESADPLQSSIRLGIIPTIGPFLLPRIIPNLTKAYPNTSLYLREEKSTELLKQLAQNSIDLLIFALPYPHNNFTIETMPLFEDKFTLALPVNHKLNTGKMESICPSEIPEPEILTLEDSHCLREHSLNACRVKRHFDSQSFFCTSLYTILQMVANGLGVALIPNMSVHSDMVKSLNLAFRPLEESTEGRQICLCWRRGSYASEAYKAIGKSIQEIIKE